MKTNTQRPPGPSPADLVLFILTIAVMFVIAWRMSGAAASPGAMSHTLPPFVDVLWIYALFRTWMTCAVGPQGGR